MASDIDPKTIIITVFFSVILLTGIIMTVPQMQDTLRGPQGETGPIGPIGPTGAPAFCEVTQAELDELAIRFDELESTIAELENYIHFEIIGFETYGDIAPILPPTWNTLIGLTSDLYQQEDLIDVVIDYIDEVYDELVLLAPQLNDLISQVDEMKTLSGYIFDSGWVSFDKGQERALTTLDNPHVLVYMVGRKDNRLAHQIYYGGDSQLVGTLQLEKGARWWIDDDNKLRVLRSPLDNYYAYIRVYVWQIPF